LTPRRRRARLVVGRRALYINPCKEPIMAKIYKGNVSVVKNTKDLIVVKKDDDGKFNADNVAELYETMVALGKKHKLQVKVYKPKPNGDTPLLFADQWGNPYVAVLPAMEAPGPVTRKTVTKLA
jgi:hypothetical protein